MTRENHLFPILLVSSALNISKWYLARYLQLLLFGWLFGHHKNKSLKIGEKIMYSEPTLGGLKKAQEFLALKGFPMPIFQMDIYSDYQLAGLRRVPGKGRTISIDEAICKYGAMHEVVDVRLTNKKGNKFVSFSWYEHFGYSYHRDAMMNGNIVIVEFHKGNPMDYKFNDFMNSNDVDVLLNLACWGKPKLTMLDRIKIRFFPKRYAAEVYA